MDQPAPPQSPAPSLFAARPPERTGPPVLLWTLAGLVLLLLAAGLLLIPRHRAPRDGSAILPQDSYASSLVLSDLKLSESASLSGGKVTYIDGHVTNTGTRTLSGATMQVLFSNDVQLPPQVETVPLTIIRTHQPYIDTEPLSAAPLKPGEVREFRLILEGIGSNWNQQVPAIHLVHATTN